MAMTRSEFLAVGIVIIAASVLLSRFQKKGRTGPHALVAALALLVVIAPWAIRNYTIFDRIVPTISHPWGEIWRGNNRYAEASSYDEAGEANWFLKPYYRPLTRRLDSLPYNGRFELAADSVFRDEVIAYVRDTPLRALGVAAGRIVLLWSVDLNHPAARNPLYIAIIVPTLLLLAAGFVLTIRRRRLPGEWAPSVIYGIFFLCTSGIVAVTHIQPRHQIYMVAVGFPFVGVALARLVEGREAGSSLSPVGGVER
jgi:hypothetical protein